MKALKYRMTTLAPLLITNNAGDPNMVSTKEYISGTVILGALAGIYIRKNNYLTNAHEKPDFNNWFLNGSLKFTNAYIVSYDDKNNIKNNVPLPNSIHYDKDNENDIYDLFFTNEDKTANKTTKIIGGFGRFDSNYLYPQKVKKSLNFHHERDPITGTTKEGMIFNYESIDSGQTFEGAIIGEEKDLSEIVQSIWKKFELNIGRSRSAQYGRIRFEFVQEKPEDIPIKTASSEISLTLLSDTIIYSKQGFSTTDKKDFEAVLKKKLGKNSIEIKKTFVKTGEIENFISIWKLRKPSETCFLMGSCFLISGIDTNNTEKLKELQINGIGERTKEGFGRVGIHLKINGKLTKKEYGDAPDSTIALPAVTKKIAEEAVKNYIRRTIEVKALDECAKFKGLPTKSLISRLEMAVKSRNYNEFIKYVDNLRDIAKDNLKKCHNDNVTLLEFLQEKEIKIDENIRPSIGRICTEIGFNSVEDTDFMNSLYKLYFETFFSAMRKEKKKEG
jgi:CRISPR-associated protein Csx10